MQLSKTGSAVLAAMVLCAGAGQAATVTATFAGAVTEARGQFMGSPGDPHTLEIVGEDDTQATPVTGNALGIVNRAINGAAPLLNGIAFEVLPSSDVSSYQLSSMRYARPQSMTSTLSNDVTGYVANDVQFGMDLFDAILIQGDVDDGNFSGTIEYFALFDAATFGSSTLNEAIVNGLANTTTVFEEAGIAQDRSTGDPLSEVFGRISIVNISRVDTPTPPPNPTPTPTPTPAPIPLPASIPLLLAGLGSLGYLRFKR